VTNALVNSLAPCQAEKTDIPIAGCICGRVFEGEAAEDGRVIVGCLESYAEDMGRLEKGTAGGWTGPVNHAWLIYVYLDSVVTGEGSRGFE
jgi:hypothetical protein